MSTTIERLRAVSSQSVLAATGAVLAAGSAQADLIITNIGETADIKEDVLIDINNDGVDDFSFLVGTAEEIDGGENRIAAEPLEFAIVTGKFRIKKPKLEVMEGPIRRGKRGIFVEDTLDDKIDAAPYAKRFEEGDVIGFDSGESRFTARLYDDRGADGGGLRDDDKMMVARVALLEEDDFGPFAEEGDSGYIGFFIDIFEDLEEDERILAQAIEVEEHEAPSVDRFFGWAEIARGSLNVIRIGFQTTPNTGAPIPRDPVGVPEPASLPLMALGAAGLFALRRKREA